ncbi:MAG TPA: hypothetical protein VFL91_15765 [Thermomicrobiales bacterium]|nr:hypothetical protein [Thermomicrobiales bacterium]
MSEQEHNGYTAEERRRQIEWLLAYPRVGPLAAGAIARNLGAPEEAIAPLLAALVADGRLRRLADGRYAAAADGRGRAT